MLGSALLAATVFAQLAQTHPAIRSAATEFAIQDAKPSPEDKAGAEAVKKLTDEWKEFAPPDNKFTVRLPGKPVEQKQVAKSLAGDINVVMYITQKGAGGALIVAATDIPNANANANVDNVLDGSRNGMVAQVPGAKVTSEKKIEFGGLPGRDIVLDVPKGKSPVPLRINVRVLYGKGVLYQFQAIQRSDIDAAISDEEIAGYYGSIKFPVKD